MNIQYIVKEPVLTEKAMASAKNSVYTFNVHKNATKPSIKKAIETIFGVVVSQVRVVTRIGHTKRVGKKGTTKRSQNQKIAFVTVKTGTISVFPTT
jgi:large subunit ribosomal protein L23